MTQQRDQAVPSIKELEETYSSSDAPVSVEMLRHLQCDPRAGSKKLYRRLKKRADLETKERTRLDSMFRLEGRLWQAGLQRIAGVDEVGLGPMAGPVVAAAVVMPPGTRIDGVNDSKRLAPDLRETLDAQIRATAWGIGVGVIETSEVDELNVYHAGLKAMRVAVESLPSPPHHVLVDGRTIPGIHAPQDKVKGGDGLCFSIACASIVAKVHRDRLMVDLEAQFPGYGFANHKGYCTPAHQHAVRQLGPCPAHRRSFDFLREVQGEYHPLFYVLKLEIASVAKPRQLRQWESRFKKFRASLSVEESRKLLLLARRRRGRLAGHKA